MSDICLQIREKLFALEDTQYKNFHSKLMPTVSSDTVIGVRIPELRKYASDLFKCPEIGEFLSDLPHKYYEENNLHAFIIEHIKDYDICINELNRFLPFVNNWATCDSMSPKILKSDLGRLEEQIYKWIASCETYTVRFGIKMLMSFYLDDCYRSEYHELVSGIDSEEYYVKMMVSWYFATALAKKYDETLPYLENNRLPIWIHNKTIQKAVESYRITDEQKTYLKTLKRTNK